MGARAQVQIIATAEQKAGEPGSVYLYTHWGTRSTKPAQPCPRFGARHSPAQPAPSLGLSTMMLTIAQKNLVDRRGGRWQNLS